MFKGHFESDVIVTVADDNETQIQATLIIAHTTKNEKYSDRKC